MAKIKICGLSRIEDIEMVNRYLPDYIGFVFTKKSRRYVSPEMAHKLKGNLDTQISAVGVFVNQPLELLEDLVARKIINFVQLHGSESQDYITKLRAQVSCPIIRSVAVGDSFSKNMPEGVDYLLFDTASAEYGGSGKAFDWRLIENIKNPYFLAGGINETNIAEAISRTNPYCVDVSSGAETGGYKNEKKIGRLVQLVRGEENI